MISCKRAVELLSKAMDGPLTQAEEKSLKIHLHICEFCEQFRKHIEMIRNKMRNFQAPIRKTISPESRNKILRKIKTKIPK